METIRIRQQGFSHRIVFAEFLRRYSFLVFSFEERIVANKETCRLLLVRLKMDGWALGKHKVFLKYYHVEHLSRLYEKEIKKIIRIQAFARRWLAKRRAEKEKWSVARSVMIMQKYARGWLVRKRVMDIKRDTLRRLEEQRIAQMNIDANKIAEIESKVPKVNGHLVKNNGDGIVVEKNRQNGHIVPPKNHKNGNKNKNPLRNGSSSPDIQPKRRNVEKIPKLIIRDPSPEGAAVVIQKREWTTNN